MEYSHFFDGYQTRGICFGIFFGIWWLCGGLGTYFYWYGLSTIKKRIYSKPPAKLSYKENFMKIEEYVQTIQEDTDRVRLLVSRYQENTLIP